MKTWSRLGLAGMAMLAALAGFNAAGAKVTLK